MLVGQKLDHEDMVLQTWSMCHQLEYCVVFVFWSQNVSNIGTIILKQEGGIIVLPKKYFL